MNSAYVKTRAIAGQFPTTANARRHSAFAFRDSTTQHNSLNDRDLGSRHGAHRSIVLISKAAVAAPEFSAATLCRKARAIHEVPLKARQSRAARSVVWCRSHHAIHPHDRDFPGAPIAPDPAWRLVIGSGDGRFIHKDTTTL